MSIDQQNIDQDEPDYSILLIQKSKGQPNRKKRKTQQKAIHPNFLRIFDEDSVKSKKKKGKGESQIGQF